MPEWVLFHFHCSLTSNENPKLFKIPCILKGLACYTELTAMSSV